MASPYSPAPGQVMHYPQPHETLPPPIQQDFTPQQEYQPEPGFEYQGVPPGQQQMPGLNQPPPMPLGQQFQPPLPDSMLGAPGVPGTIGGPPGAMPPGAMPPGVMPPGVMPPGVPGTIGGPPGAMPPGVMPPGVMPPGVPGTIGGPPGAMPPGVMPGGVPGTIGGPPGMQPMLGVPMGPPPMQMPFPAPFPYDPGFQPPLWTPFHLQSLIPPDTPPHEILPPSLLATIVPLRSDTHVDRDLALMLNKAYKYSGRSNSGHQSRRKYGKYVFLAGLLLSKRGLPAVAVPDDPEDAHVKVLQVYLSNTGRLGANPDAVLMKELAKGGGYYADEDTGRRSSRSGRRSESSGRSGRSKSASRRSGGRRRSKSASRRSERKSSSRHASSDDTSDWGE